MSFLYLVLFFLVIGLILSSLWYLLPYLLAFWAIMTVINYFRTRKVRKQIQENYDSLFDQAFKTRMNHSNHTQVPVRRPMEGAIDAEFTERDDDETSYS